MHLPLALSLLAALPLAAAAAANKPTSGAPLALGVDFGDSSTVVAGLDGSVGLRILCNDASGRAMPSEVCFAAEARFLAEQSLSHASRDPARRFARLKSGLAADGADADATLRFRGADTSVSPLSVATAFLSHVARFAESGDGADGGAPRRVVAAALGAPAWWAPAHRAALAGAAAAAFSNATVLTVVDELAAAAVAYRLARRRELEDEARAVASAAVSGGAGDGSRLVALVDVGRAGAQCGVFAVDSVGVKVLGLAGDAGAGTDALVAALKRHACEALGLDPSNDPRLDAALDVSCARAVKTLSANAGAAVHVDESPDGSRPAARCAVTREQFEAMARATVLPRLDAACEAALAQAEAALDGAPLHSVELLGGGAHVPCVARCVRAALCEGDNLGAEDAEGAEFGGGAVPLCRSLPPKEAVANGLALVAAAAAPGMRFAAKAAVRAALRHPVAIATPGAAGAPALELEAGADAPHEAEFRVALDTCGGRTTGLPAVLVGSVDGAPHHAFQLSAEVNAKAAGAEWVEVKAVVGSDGFARVVSAKDPYGQRLAVAASALAAPDDAAQAALRRAEAAAFSRDGRIAAAAGARNALEAAVYAARDDLDAEAFGPAAAAADVAAARAAVEAAGAWLDDNAGSGDPDAVARQRARLDARMARLSEAKAAADLAEAADAARAAALAAAADALDAAKGAGELCALEAQRLERAVAAAAAAGAGAKPSGRWRRAGVAASAEADAERVQAVRAAEAELRARMAVVAGGAGAGAGDAAADEGAAEADDVVAGSAAGAAE